MAKEEQKVELKEIPTQTATMFLTPEGEQLNFEEYLVWIGNLLWDTKKAVAG